MATNPNPMQNPSPPPKPGPADRTNSAPYQTPSVGLKPGPKGARGLVTGRPQVDSSPTNADRKFGTVR
jgi:hypothetical protein